MSLNLYSRKGPIFNEEKCTANLKKKCPKLYYKLKLVFTQVWNEQKKYFLRNTTYPRN